MLVTFPLGFAHGRNLAIDFAHAERTGVFALCLLAACSICRWGRGYVPDIVLDAHDDYRGLATAVNQKPLVSFSCPLDDLAQLSAGRDGRNHVFHGYFSLFNENTPELINQFN
jgi:hypothetical protein